MGVDRARRGRDIHPQNQSQSDGASAYTYLSEHTGELSETTNFERVLMVVDAAGTSPQDFGDVSLVQAILNRKLPNGGFAHDQGDGTPGVNDTIFAIIALSPIREPAVQEAISARGGMARERPELERRQLSHNRARRQHRYHRRRDRGAECRRRA